MKNTYTTPQTYLKKVFSKNMLTFLTLGTASIATSFAIGMQTAGDIQPFSLIEAGGNGIIGDINNDRVVNTSDVIMLLEMSQGYTETTPEAFEADPNQDGRLTVDDAIKLLKTIQ